MHNQKIYDIIGIGAGPFNLGLAALCHGIPELECLFVDQHTNFNWHPGMLLPNARLQVPFYADLVTLTDPCNPFSYFNFLNHKERMYRFAISENYFIKRHQYNQYCQWVAGQLPAVQFNTSCERIEKGNGIYKVTTNQGVFLSSNIVLGTGTVPFIPEFAKTMSTGFHSSAYLFNKEKILQEDSITIVGSGQSAAEIFYDLLQNYEGGLDWFTRSKSFYPMDYSKLSLELSTPDYIDYFYSLPKAVRQTVLQSQDALYKGINQCLISDIYDLLDEKNLSYQPLHANCELKEIAGDGSLHFLHTELRETFVHPCSAVILATGYQPIVPPCIDALRPFIQLDEAGMYSPHHNYSIDGNNSIFIQNGEQLTHGFNASDLSLGPYRNAVILNTILGYEQYKIERNVTFQTFGLPVSQRTSKDACRQTGRFNG